VAPRPSVSRSRGSPLTLVRPCSARAGRPADRPGSGAPSRRPRRPRGGPGRLGPVRCRGVLCARQPVGDFFLLAGVVFLCVLAIPVLSLQLGHDGDAGAGPGRLHRQAGLRTATSELGVRAPGHCTVHRVIQPGHGAASSSAQQLAGPGAGGPGRGRAPAWRPGEPGPGHPGRANPWVTTVVPVSTAADAATRTLRAVHPLLATTLPSAAGRDPPASPSCYVDSFLDPPSQPTTLPATGRRPASRWSISPWLLSPRRFFLARLLAHLSAAPVLGSRPSAPLTPAVHRPRPYGCWSSVFHWGWAARSRRQRRKRSRSSPTVPRMIVRHRSSGCPWTTRVSFLLSAGSGGLDSALLDKNHARCASGWP